MRISGATMAVWCAIGLITAGCLGEGRRFRSASGAPGAISTKALRGPVVRPKAAIGSAARANRASAADQGESCAAAEEGRGACADRWLLFCSNGELYALDCATFVDDAGNAATCGEVEPGALDCGSDESRD